MNPWFSKDPSKAKAYGTGGLGKLKAELSGEPATRGAVAAVLQPDNPDSAGAQFFVCVSDQPALTGRYTIFGRVSEGMDVVTKISEAAVSPVLEAIEASPVNSEAPVTRIELKSVRVVKDPGA